MSFDEKRATVARVNGWVICSRSIAELAMLRLTCFVQRRFVFGDSGRKEAGAVENRLHVAVAGIDSLR